MWQFRILSKEPQDEDWFHNEFYDSYRAALDQVNKEKDIDEVVKSDYSLIFEYKIQARKVSEWVDVPAKKGKKG